MDNNIKQIKEIQFSLINPEEIRRKGVCQLTNSDNSINKNKEVNNGIFDYKMGTISENILCKTCKNDYETCPGHFGYIDLVKPVFYPHYIPDIKKILKCLCKKCINIVLKIDNNLKEKILLINKKKRMDFVYNKIIKLKNCEHCNNPILKVDSNKKKEIFYKIEGEENILLSAEKIHTMFSCISDEISLLLGLDPQYSRPEWLLCTTLIIPPPCIRPYIKIGNSIKSQDDLTYKILEIIKANDRLSEKIQKNGTPHEVNELLGYLQYHVLTYIDNNIKNQAYSKHKSGRVIKTLKERIVGKAGRVRKNIMGKRVNYSGRSVISPEPLNNIDELSVPIHICKILTYPEVVNDINFERLSKLITKHPNDYPAAESVIKNDMKISIKFNRNIKLEIGDIVERHLVKGDVITFNRAPSLQKSNIMCLKINPCKDKTLKPPPTIAAAFNFDYDGDEMNVFNPRSEVTRNEIRDLMSVYRQIIAPQYNKPIVSFIMDSVVGMYRLTKDDRLLPYNTVLKIIASLDNFDVKLPEPILIDNKQYFKGKDILSYVLPKINYKCKDVIIEKGIIKSGIFDKSITGKSNGSLIHVINNDMGGKYVKDYMGETQKFIHSFLKTEGFSVGLSDMIVNNKINKQIDNIIKDSKDKVNEYILRVRSKGNKILKKDFENHIFSLLNKATENSGKLVLENVDKNNILVDMVKSGSKGNFINISQITCLVGQQNVQNGENQGRVDFLLNQRTLPHYQKYDDGPESRGFISNSYLKGLNPQEFFFHSMSGREGLIDTA